MSKAIINIDTEGHIFCTSNMLAERFIPNVKDGLRDILRTSLSTIFDLGFYPKSQLGSHPVEIIKPKQKDIIRFYFDSKEEIEFTSSISKAWFKLTYYMSRGKKYNQIQMNRQGFMLITMQLGRYKNALRTQEEFIKAFDLLEQRYLSTHSENVNDKVLKAILPFDDFGTISKVNDEPRVKLVHSYYRSKNGAKIEKGLIKQIHDLKTGMFAEQFVLDIECLEKKLEQHRIKYKL